MRFLIATATLFISITAATSAWADDFNRFVLESVQFLSDNYSSKGYDISSAFTHDIAYDGQGSIKPTNPEKTMCVAAVTEVILEAMNRYAAETKDETIFQKIPLRSWTSGTVLSLRANLFMFAGTGSQGTAQTLEEFGLGEQLRFRDLQPGDFINLNRKGNNIPDTVLRIGNG